MLPRIRWEHYRTLSHRKLPKDSGGDRYIVRQPVSCSVINIAHSPKRMCDGPAGIGTIPAELACPTGVIRLFLDTRRGRQQLRGLGSAFTVYRAVDDDALCQNAHRLKPDLPI